MEKTVQLYFPLFERCIVAPDGSEFVFEEKIKAEATVGSMTDIATGEGLPITSTLDNIIQNEDDIVNSYSEKNEKNIPKTCRARANYLTMT